MASSFRPSPSALACRYPAVHFSARVFAGIRREVLDAFRAVPRRGAETGGILLGRIGVQGILVQDFEPVLCEHRFGPSFQLSDEDLRGLGESLDWFRNPASGELKVLGLYRSQTRAGWDGGAGDSDLMERCHCEQGQLFLLLRPNRDETVAAELFVYEAGELKPAAGPIAFASERGPFTIAAPADSAEAGSPRAAPPADLPAPQPAPDSGPAAKASLSDSGTEAELPPLAQRRRIPALPPSTRAGRALLETPPASRRPWRMAVFGAATVTALLIGYGAVVHRPHPAPATPRGGDPPEGTVTSPAAVQPFPAPRPETASAASSPAPPRPDTAAPAPSPARAVDVRREVRDALERWAAALRSGDPERIAACYAPRLEVYFGASNVTQKAVLRGASDSRSRRGKLAVLRYTDLLIIPLSPTRVIVTFRKHWQTAGPRFLSGELEERLTFARAPATPAADWKIVAEQETRVYWTQRGR